MRLHWRFEWDEGKSARNSAKHGVSFAAAALSDEHGDLCHLERNDKAPGSSAHDWRLARKENGMRGTSRNKPGRRIIHRDARGLARRSEKVMADLQRRAASIARPPDTSDIPEQPPSDGTWVRGGHLVGGIRGAIVGEMQRQGLTRYQLWKKAHFLCPKLPSSAVYEYLDGRRQVGGTYIEAMLDALKLEIKPKATA